LLTYNDESWSAVAKSFLVESCTDGLPMIVLGACAVLLGRVVFMRL